MSAQSILEYLWELGIRPDNRVECPTNKEMLIMALTELGGVAHLDTIYKCYRRIRTMWRTDLPWKSEEQIAKIVSVTLRRYAVGGQASDVREEERCFVKCGEGLGYWRLVSWVRYDKKENTIVWDRV